MDVIARWKTLFFLIETSNFKHRITNTISCRMNIKNLPKEWWKDKEIFTNVARNFKYVARFRNKYRAAWKYGEQMGWTSEIFEGMPDKHRKPNGYWTKEECHKRAILCTSPREFQTRFGSAYTKAVANGWLDEICSHMTFHGREHRKDWWEVKEHCYDEAHKHRSIKSFERYSALAYKAAVAHGWLEEICEGMPKTLRLPNGEWNIETGTKEANKYESRTEFANKNKACFLYAYRHGFLDEICKDIDAKQKDRNKFKHKNGYWNNITRCLEAATECETKREFSKRFATAHKYVCQNKWQDIVFARFPVLANNTKRCVYVFEFEDHSAYIGLTYDDKRRLKDHLNDPYSAVYQHIKSTESSYFFAIVVDYTDYKIASRKEGEILGQYARDGWKILNRIATGALGGNIVKHTKEACRAIALKYNVKQEFREKEPKVYMAICRNHWIEELCSHQISRPSKYNYENIFNEAKKYDRTRDFVEHSRKFYDAAYRLGILDEVTAHMAVGRTLFSRKQIYETAYSCEYYEDFRHDHYDVYKTAKNLGMTEEISRNMKHGGKHLRGDFKTYDKCKNKASNYHSIQEFHDKCANAFFYAQNEGWLEKIAEDLGW